MKLFRLVVLLAACLPSPARADTLTPCTGSWDGPGLTACELLGEPGLVGAAWGDWSIYALSPLPLYEITAYDVGNTLRVDQLGQLVYQRSPGGTVFASLLHPRQFAVWARGATRIVGIEDLTDADLTGSDWDYNDWVAAFTTSNDVSVPEPAAVGLFLLAVGWALRRRME